MRRLRHREVKQFAQIPIVQKWLSQNLDRVGLAAKSSSSLFQAASQEQGTGRVAGVWHIVRA